MTLALILGGAVAIYFIWFLFRLAVLALPVCTGIAAFFALLDRGMSYPVSILGGVALGAIILVSARLLLAAHIAPAVRAAVALAFAVPAALAGYAATRSLVGLAGPDGAVQVTLSLAGAAVTALASWHSLAGLISPLPPGPTVRRDQPL